MSTTMQNSFISRLSDTLMPRLCPVCGVRLSADEVGFCTQCLMRMPRTDHVSHPNDNVMAMSYWGRVSHIERAAAFLYYHNLSEAMRPIYQLKYYHRPHLATAFGLAMGRELAGAGFTADIDMIIPVPLAPRRQRQRGYNQSDFFARGLAATTGLPVAADVLRRVTFTESQTHKDRWERYANVKDAFRLVRPEAVSGRHVLLVDDVVTTGATTIACALELEKAGEVRVSVASIAFVDKNQ